MSMADTRNAPSQTAAFSDMPLVEIGWLVAGAIDNTDWQATRKARDGLVAQLQATLPQFTWQMPIVRRDELTAGPREQPVVLLQHGVAERNSKHWDFTVIVTGVELESHYQAETTAVVSRSLDAFLVSTSRLASWLDDSTVSAEERIDAMASALQRVVLYGIGRLCGLAQCDDDSNCMSSLTERSASDRPAEISQEQILRLAEELEEVADGRLEEHQGDRRIHPWKFYAVSCWVNRLDIAASVWEARPWQFPFRLSRLTTAVISAMLVLMVTAEVWELASSQRASFVTLLSLVAVGFATTYVILRQRLYTKATKWRMTEQTVTTNVATALIVLTGMTTTYLCVFAVGLLAGVTLFRPQLVRNWSGSVAQPPVLDEYILLSAFVAALSLFIGALGATFENNHYFRHITFVDEELFG